MSIITLTTDFGYKDHFIGSVKGALYSEIPNVKIVEITNLISPFNIIEAANKVKVNHLIIASS